MHHAGDDQDILFKKPKGIGVCQHQGCNRIIQLGSKILQINKTTLITGDGNHIKPIHCSTCWIGTVGTDRNQHLLPCIIALLEKVGADHLEACVLTMGPCTRLECPPAHAGDGREVFQQVVHYR
ncbi:hypothetical protein SDC9_177188 [bioreactor metagenome]|uniref:Uncharacterized protein n=1 Tax=bioreactor metagenome TaxID=1076179 RepID=A0A645GSM0_9ZZZZ